MFAKIICMGNNKGGSSKSTSCVNLAAQLAILRKKVLVVDIGAQAHSSLMFGLEDPETKDMHIGNALLDPKSFKSYIHNVEFIKKEGRKKYKRYLDIVPAHTDLNHVELQLVTEKARNTRLKKCLDSVREDYDFIIIDTPPSIQICSKNALVASDFYIPVVDCSGLAVKSLEHYIDFVTSTRKQSNKNLTCLGVFFTKFEGTNAHKKNIETVKEAFNKNVFKTCIPSFTKFHVDRFEPICSYAPKSVANVKYLDFAKEVIKRTKKYQ